MQMHYFCHMTILEYAAKVTARKQTTIPSAVYKALNLTDSDRIVFKVKEDGSVQLTKAEQPHEAQEDPAISAFLAFLEREITQNPSRLQPLTLDFFNNLSDLTAGVDKNFDFDTPLDPNDE